MAGVRYIIHSEETLVRSQCLDLDEVKIETISDLRHYLLSKGFVSQGENLYFYRFQSACYQNDKVLNETYTGCFPEESLNNTTDQIITFYVCINKPLFYCKGHNSVEDDIYRNIYIDSEGYGKHHPTELIEENGHDKFRLVFEPEPVIEKNVVISEITKSSSLPLHPVTKAGIALVCLGFCCVIAGALLTFFTGGASLLILGMSTKLVTDCLLMIGGGAMLGGVVLGGGAECAQYTLCN